MKAQAQAIIHRVRIALDELGDTVSAGQRSIGHDLDELSDAVDSIPDDEGEGEVIVDDGEPADAGSDA